MASPPGRTSRGKVRLWWYAIFLVPIVALVVAPLYGWVPGEFLVVGLFAGFFWLFSLGFAIYAMTRKRKELRQ